MWSLFSRPTQALLQLFIWKAATAPAMTWGLGSLALSLVLSSWMTSRIIDDSWVMEKTDIHLTHWPRISTDMKGYGIMWPQDVITSLHTYNKLIITYPPPRDRIWTILSSQPGLPKKLIEFLEFILLWLQRWQKIPPPFLLPFLNKLLHPCICQGQC